MTERDAENRTEANQPVEGKDHVPSARMDKETRKREAPGIDEHDAGGQGLSG